MPTPPLTLENYWWVTQAQPESWGSFCARGLTAPSVEVRFAPEGRGIEPLTQAELTLLEWFFAHEETVSAAVQHAILAAYPEIQADFGFESEDGQELLPDITTTEGLKSLVSLQSVNVHQVSHNGVPYLGFELSCTWDQEHGLGVLMHGTRLVEVGGADTAVLLWLAERDAKRHG
jgi:hypothetical protein